MIGVALEGGGALGAYHIGAIKALNQHGCKFDGYVGTSIGAINAAVLAQGDFDALEAQWRDISTEQLFSEPIARLLSLSEHPLISGPGIDLPKFIQAVRRGVDTTKMKAFIRALLDEDKLRSSGVDFGLVTVRLSGLRPREMWLSDIPYGQLVEWIMASASFPGFQPEVIEGETYVDGGLRNNCPINLLTDRGYERVYAIRTFGPGLFHMPQTSAEVTLIAPTKRLGNVMLFEGEQSRRNMMLGYLDARRVLGHTVGDNYYVNPDLHIDGFSLLAAIDEASIARIAKWYPTENVNPKRLLFERVLPDLAAHLKLREDRSYDDVVLNLLELAAESLGMDALREYSLSDFAQAVAQSDDSEAAFKLGEHLPATVQILARQIAIHLLGATGG